jgi:hypothetical protein
MMNATPTLTTGFVFFDVKPFLPADAHQICPYVQACLERLIGHPFHSMRRPTMKLAAR